MSPEHSAHRIPHSAFRALWRSLASVRLAVVLLIVLAIAATVGIVLPQPESFTASTYIEQRLDPRSEHPLTPAEFVCDARAAGVLRGDAAFEALAKRVEAGGLSDEQWQGFASMVAHKLQQDQTSIACLRLSYVDSFGRFLGRVLLFLQIHGLFTSAWFRLLCALLLANLVACSVERLPGQWRMAFGHRPADEPGWYRRRAIHAVVVLPGASGTGSVAEGVEKAIRQRGFRTEHSEGPQGALLEGTRGWLGALGRLWRPLGKLAGLGRLGAQVVHLGVVMILVGGFLSGCLSFRHAQLLARGEVVAVPDVSYRLSPGYQLRKLGAEVRRFFGIRTNATPSEAELAAEAPDWRESPGEPARNAAFRMRLRRFEFRTDPRGKPEYYGSHAAVLDTNPPTDVVIEVNHPLVYGGFHVYQQSYQPDYRGIMSVSFLVAKVRRAGGVASASHEEQAAAEVLQQVSLAVPPDATVPVPGLGLSLRILRYFPHWQIPLEQTPEGRIVAGEARNLSDEPVNPAVQVRLEAPGMAPQQRWIPLPFRSGEPRPGGVIDCGEYRIIPIDFRPDYATWLTFKTHPVMLPVWIGCGVMMLGIVLCFYCNHERLWAFARPLGDGRVELLLAGESFKWRDQFKQSFQALAAEVEAGGGKERTRLERTR